MYTSRGGEREKQKWEKDGEREGEKVGETLNWLK